jgi:putative transposase
MTKRSPFRYFKTSPEVVRLAAMLYVRCPLSRRNVEDLLHERGIEISHETVRFWWNRFGPRFAASGWNDHGPCPTGALSEELYLRPAGPSSSLKR